jgi:hypothetical protein
VIVTGPGPLRTSAAELATRTGWVAKPEGLCKGPMCVPLPGGTTDPLDLEVVATRLGMPVLRDAEHGVTALGPATVGGRALDTAEVPELTLPNLVDGGAPFALSSLRGKKKVVAFAWASW